MLTPITHAATALQSAAPEPLDLEALLPISMIRAHTKTDDIPAVTDAQLQLYRRAAIEAAEKYTGMLLRERRSITEAVNAPVRATRKHFLHRTRYPFAHPVAWLYGKGAPVPVPVDVGSRRVALMIEHDDFGLGCCNPCADKAAHRLMYYAGYSCETQIPACIALGALKYIAHVIENPGDVAYAMSASGSAMGGVSVVETSNPAIASGAVEIWRSCKDDAI